MANAQIVELEAAHIPGLALLGGPLDPAAQAAAEARLHERFLGEFGRRGIHLVALLGEAVIGSQTYVPWPYRRAGRVYRSFHSGATIVREDYRRLCVRGPDRKWVTLYVAMLQEGDRLARERDVDFFMGFPNPLSEGGFSEAGWSALGRLRWWVKPLRPLLLWRGLQGDHPAQVPLALGEPLSPTPPGGRVLGDRDPFLLTSDDPEFHAWRTPPALAQERRRFTFKAGGGWVSFALKQRTDRGFRELVVGEIRGSSGSWLLWRRALHALAQAARRERSIAAISLLEWPMQPTERALFASAGFAPSRFAAPLIVKSFGEVPGLNDPEQWAVSGWDINAW